LYVALKPGLRAAVLAALFDVITVDAYGKVR